MNIDWTFRGEPLPEDVQDRISQHLSKLGRFLRDPADAHVVVAHEGPKHQRVEIEIVLTSPDGTVKGRGEGRDVIEVAREVLQRVETQAQKAHAKRREGRRRDGAEPVEPVAAVGEED